MAIKAFYQGIRSGKLTTLFIGKDPKPIWPIISSSGMLRLRSSVGLKMKGQLKSSLPQGLPLRKENDP